MTHLKYKSTHKNEVVRNLNKYSITRIYQTRTIMGLFCLILGQFGFLGSFWASVVLLVILILETFGLKMKCVNRWNKNIQWFKFKLDNQKNQSGSTFLVGPTGPCQCRLRLKLFAEGWKVNPKEGNFSFNTYWYSKDPTLYYD